MINKLSQRKIISAIKRKRRTFIICGHIMLKKQDMIVLNDKVFDNYPFNMLKKKEFNKRLSINSRQK
jgi:hypothetical protein